MYKETKLIINNDKLKGKKIVVISDIHYVNNKDIKKLEKLLKVLNKYNADYICIPGDIIDNNDTIDKNYIISWLERLSKNNTVIMSLGNHDLRIDDEIAKYKYYVDDNFINKLSNIDNLYLLNNSSKSYKDIYFYGYTESFDYYYKNNDEDKNIMNKELDKYKVCNDLPNKYRVLLMHSPLCLKYKDIKEKLNCYDLILCGHMHNGVMPPILDDIFRGNRGIVSPNKRLFPKFARGIIKNNNTVVISSGITKMARNLIFPLRILNIFFPIGINVIEFSNYDEIKNRYFTK